jgi:plastocyanin
LPKQLVYSTIDLNAMHCRLIFVLLFVGHSLQAQQRLTAALTGHVNWPTKPAAVVQGHGYNKDGTAMMHAEDPLAKAERNIIISVHPLDFQPPLTATPDAIITQKQQTFIPYVLPVTKGSTIYFLNEDEFFHSIYTLTPGHRFNIGRRPPGSPYALKIQKSGTIKLSCDIHPHMEAFVLSLDTPYFVRVDAAGNYTLQNLPAGKYRVEAFHPTDRKLVQYVELIAGKTQQLHFNRALVK